MFSAKTSFPICIRLDFLICISLDWCHHSLISFHCLTCSLGTLSWQPLLASWTTRKPGGRMLVAKCSASSTEWKFCESDRCSRIFILWCILSIPSWLPKALKRDIWAVLVVLKNYACKFYFQMLSCATGWILLVLAVVEFAWWYAPFEVEEMLLSSSWVLCLLLCILFMQSKVLGPLVERRNRERW